jgi:hypothetical protein
MFFYGNLGRALRGGGHRGISKRYLFRVFCSKRYKSEKVGKFAFSFFMKNKPTSKKVGLSRQRACDGKVRNTWAFFSKKIPFLT